MKIVRDDLRKAAGAGLVSSEQADALWRFLEQLSADEGRVRFGPEQLLWYAGALLIMGAMGLFTTLGFSSWGYGFLFTTALAYGVLLGGAGHVLWNRPGLRPAGGVLLASAVAMTPLAVFAVQSMLGWWGKGAPGSYSGFYVWIKGGWVFMEVTTIVVGSAVLWRYRFSFMLLPVAMMLWFLSMDLAPWVMGSKALTFETHQSVSIWFGLASMAAAWLVDARSRSDLSFWLHLAGLMAFWGGLTSSHGSGELAKLVYCLINVVLVGGGLFLDRRAYVAFGGMGIAIYLGHLAEKVFKDSILFPFALSGLGIAVIVGGLALRRHRAALESWVTRVMPAPLAALRPLRLRQPAG